MGCDQCLLSLTVFSKTLINCFEGLTVGLPLQYTFFHGWIEKCGDSLCLCIKILFVSFIIIFFYQLSRFCHSFAGLAPIQQFVVSVIVFLLSYLPFPQVLFGVWKGLLLAISMSAHYCSLEGRDLSL